MSREIVGFSVLRDISLSSRGKNSTEASPSLKYCLHDLLFPAFCAKLVQDAGMFDGYPTTGGNGAAKEWAYFMHTTNRRQAKQTRRTRQTC